MSKDEESKSLSDIIAEIEKSHGKGSVMMLGSKRFVAIDVIPTSSLALDVALGVGGMPRGRVIEIYGPECLAADTFIQYSVRTKQGRLNHKGGSIRRLHERFHNIPASGDGRGKNRNNMARVAEFFAPAMNDEGRIVQNQIMDVVVAGRKQCFSVRTELGQNIVASSDHIFLTPGGERTLESLEVGDVVYIHNNTPFKVAKPKDSNKRRHFVYVRHHPVAGIKNCGGYLYHRLRLARAIMEAHINNLPLAEYIGRLNRGATEGLKFIPREINVHHKDENEANDVLDNLEMLHTIPHSVLHATKRHNNLRFIAIQTKIEKITPVGLRDTYDIVMADPCRNFVADGFVVHNSGGKTTLALHIIAQAQKLGGQAAYIDAEHALDPVYARKLGVDVDHMLVAQPDNGEQALEITQSLIQSGKVAVIVVDSVAALVPKAELEGDMGSPQMGLQARLMSQALRKLTAMTNQTRTVLIFINQIREKIGVMFGSPEVTTGGRALKFFATVRLDIRKTQLVKDGDSVLGADTRIRVVKNKVASPFTEAEVRILYGQGISHEWDLVRLGVEKGIIEKSGSWLSYKGQKIGQGSEQSRVFLLQNPEIASKIETDLRVILFPKGDK